MTHDDAKRAGRPSQLFRNLNAKIASIPMILTALVVFVGGTVWTVVYSFTNSKLLPRRISSGSTSMSGFGCAALADLDREPLHLRRAVADLLLVIGFLLAALMDQKIRFENTFRTIFLYPFALSFIVTGLVWQWILNPGIRRAAVVRGLGWESFTFDPLYDQRYRHLRHPDRRPLAGHGPCHVPDAGRPARHRRGHLEGARVDGIPMWKTYLFIVIPMMRPVFITTLVIIASASSRSTTSSSRRPAAVRASRRKCRRNMSTTTCSRRRISARASRPRP
jgi:glucose/mannose transport system permease protein